MFAYLAVTDTGLGMSEETRQKIFEPFFTTKEVGKGTGLGLAITYGIIKQHLGYVNIYSEPGKGSTFKIYLPAAKMTVSHGRTVKLPLLIGKSENIMVTEDDATVRDSIRKMLEEFGYKVIEAVSGEDAVEKFSLNRENIKLLILDVVMPGMNGRETYEEIKKINPAIKAIFTSGYTAEFLKQKKIFNDDQMILTKPIVPEKFLSKIREMLDETEKGPEPRGVQGKRSKQ
jgi:polar amino acid transport system substrate-binding protein